MIEQWWADKQFMRGQESNFDEGKRMNMISSRKRSSLNTSIDGRLLRATNWLIAFLFLFVAFTCPAQTAVTGALAGTVLDSTGAVVPAAQIKITNESTNEMRSTVSGPDGRYSLPLLSPGKYRIEVSRAGFKSSVRSGIQITVTETASLNISLEVGATSETVTVEENQQLIQTDNSALGRVVESEGVVNLPLVARSYTQILGLSPGVSMGVTNAGDLGHGSSASSGSGATGGGLPSNGTIVDGSRPYDNNFQMNGIAVNDNMALGAGTNYGTVDVSGGLPVPNPDTIQEFKVQTGQYDATFGRNAGANVNIVTKTGTDSFHGNVFEFFRNDALNANDFFRNGLGQPRPILRQNQFGFTLGGPVVRSKLLFFTSYQGTRQSNGIATGCLASYSGPPLTSDRSASALGSLFAGQSGVFGGVAVNASGSNINPIAMAIMNLKMPNGQYLVPTPQKVDTSLPLAAQGESSYSSPCTYNEDQFMTNAQYQQSAKSTFTGRYFQSMNNTVLSLGSSNVPGAPSPSNDTYYNLSLTHTYIFTDHLVNEALVGYNNIQAIQPQGVIGTNTPFTWQSVGANVPSDFGEQDFIVNGSVTAVEQPAFDVKQPAFTIVDNVSFSRGKHVLRVGGGLSREYINISRYTLPTAPVPLSFPDFLIGLPAGPVAQGGNGTSFSNIYVTYGGVIDFERRLRKWDGDSYVQDDYKILPHLTLNLGFRYDRLGTLNDALGRLAIFDRSKANPNGPAGGTLTGFVVAGNYPGTPPVEVSETNHDYAIDGDAQNNWAPRVGFAWQILPKSSALVLRGGYGIYASALPGATTYYSTFTTPPWIYNATVENNTTPQMSLLNPFGLGPFPTQSQLPLFIPYSQSSPISQMTYQAPHYRPGYIHEFTFNTQSDLGHDLLWEVAYVGAHGIHLTQANLPNEALKATPSAPVHGVTTTTVANLSQRVPILGITPVGLVEAGAEGQSWYNALQTSVTKRMSHGLQFLASYTFSKNLDTDALNVEEATQGTTADSPGDQLDPHRRYGRTIFDRPNRFLVSYSYALPGLKHGVPTTRLLLNGWLLSGVTTYQSGSALTVRATNGQSAFGATEDFAPLSGQCKAGGFLNPGSAKKNLKGYFNTQCFALDPTTRAPVFPVIGDDGIATGYGNEGVGIALGPPQRNWDIAITKHTSVGWPNENANVEFRTEFFNAFNIAQFGNPDTVLNDATFGVITKTAVNPRIVQFALKLNF